MRVAQRCAGYSLAEADNLRKACGKKIRELIAAEREKFVAGCERTGYGTELGTKLFDIIEPFADYAFNKSHAFGYGLVAYQTAWLKANYPVQYLAALLTSVKDNKDKTALYLAEASSLGIDVLVPDVNRSMADFVVVNEAGKEQILFGLAAIRNVGEGLVGLIIEERNAGGPFRDFADFCLRVSPTVLNKRTVESLIKGGAFDSLGATRKALLEVHEQVIDEAIERRRERDRGVFGLFDDPEEVAVGALSLKVELARDEWPQEVLLAYEREMLGLYVSSHPLAGLEGLLRASEGVLVSDLLERLETETTASQVQVLGVVTSLARRHTRKGEVMATATLEDLRGAIEVVFFPRTLADYGTLLAQDAIVRITGRVEHREEQPKLLATAVEPIELAGEPDGTRTVTIQLPDQLATERHLGLLREVLESHEGSHPVVIEVGPLSFELVGRRVPIDGSLLGHLRAAFGDSVGVR